tara:strand:+ start:1348 stop:2601 length:1254 start_codon:yes stop_codon:yes gene_type:complete
MGDTNKISFDKILICIYSALVFIGYFSIYSSSFSGTETKILTVTTISGKQLIFILLSLITGLLILLTDLKLIIRSSYFLYALSIISLILVLIFGKEVGGAKAWFSIGGFGFQPSEFVKLTTILSISKYIHDNEIYLNSLKNIIKISLFIMIPAFLILLQPDAGSTLVFLGLVIMIFREGFQNRYVFGIVITSLFSVLTILIGVSKTIIFLIFCTLIFFIFLKKYSKRLMLSLIFFITCSTIISGINFSYENILQPHQKERIDIIIGKEKNKLGSGYNLNQSLIAIGSGGITGKGFLKGTQNKGNFVPEQNTDFIFCTIGEEFGFVGSLVTLSLFFSLILRIIYLSEKQYSRLNRVYGYSLASIIFTHVFVNIGMTIGLVPVIGIPLPFLSYGGSSMLSFSLMFFLFLKLNASKLERF